MVIEKRMLIRFIDFLTPLLQFLPPEVAHKFALLSLKILSLIGLISSSEDQKPKTLLGLEFKNMIGLAAGLDKNGDYIDALCCLGFGFLEIGTVTPRPQKGNSKPRLFRIKKDLALLNKMGFNNKGVDHLVKKLKKSDLGCVLGISIGKNADTPNEKALDDYLHCLKKVYEFADYIAINISSPNTENLRDLQSEDNLTLLLKGLVKERRSLQENFGYKPLLVKVSPNLSSENINSISEVIKSQEVDGLICSNTSNDHSFEPKGAGLSGLPILEISNLVLSEFRSILGKDFPIIASGGVMDKESYESKILSGADLVQIYTGIIYKGPGLIQRLND